MDCEYRRKYTEKASRDLRRIVQYITEELGNPNAARGVMAAVQKCTAGLCMFPSSGVLVPEAYRADMTVRKKLVENYILYYGVDKEKRVIWVLRIVYGARNMDAVLKNLSN